jgi:hypothetical protein
MKRIVLYTTTALAAAALASAPAAVGLVGNPSFSKQISVPTPSGASSVHLVDHTLEVSRGKDKSHSPTATSTPTAAMPAATASEPGDDNTSATNSAEPGDDNTSVTNSAEPGDDNSSGSAEPGDDNDNASGSVTNSAEPGDDNASGSASAEPGDEHGGSATAGSTTAASGHGGNGSDDGSGHH